MACSTVLPKEAAHIVRFEPQADMSVVHHMLLYLCPSEPLVRRHTGVYPAETTSAAGAQPALSTLNNPPR